MEGFDMSARSLMQRGQMGREWIMHSEQTTPGGGLSAWELSSANKTKKNKSVLVT